MKKVRAGSAAWADEDMYEAIGLRGDMAAVWEQCSRMIDDEHDRQVSRRRRPRRDRMR